MNTTKQRKTGLLHRRECDITCCGSNMCVSHSLYHVFLDLEEFQVTEKNQEKQDDDQDGPKA